MSEPQPQPQPQKQEKFRQFMLRKSLTVGNVDKPLFRDINPATNRPNTPMLHQALAVQKAVFRNRNKKQFILGHKMGSGKTATSVLTYIMACHKQGRVLPCIIVCPKACLSQWKKTFEEWTTLPRDSIQFQTKTENCTVRILTPQALVKTFKKTHAVYPDLLEEEVEGVVRYRKGWAPKGLHKNAPGDWRCSDGKHWTCMDVTRMLDMDEIFKRTDFFVVCDEVHQFRNENSIMCAAMNKLSSVNTQVLGCSGTLVHNRVADLAGIAKAMSIEDSMIKTLSRHDKHNTHLHPRAIAIFNEFVDYYKDDCVPMPAITRTAVDFNLHIANCQAGTYENILGTLFDLKAEMEENVATEDAYKEFLILVQKLQKFTISPLLLKHGKELFKNADLLKAAVSDEHATGVMKTIVQQLEILQNSGHKRIVVTSTLVQPMKLMIAYLKRLKDEGKVHTGKTFIYEGSMGDEDRQRCKQGFLAADMAVLFLSGGAGGTGLDLVGGLGCSAMVFMPPMPWTQSLVDQIEARIIRVGQNAAQVKIVFVVPRHGIDSGVCGIHFDKKRIRDCIENNSHTQINIQDLSRNLRVLDRCRYPKEYTDGYIRFQEPENNKELLPGVFY